MEIYESESKDIKAKGYLNEDNSFIILKDSCAVNDTDLHSSFLSRNKRVQIRKNLIKKGKLILKNNKYIFSTNVKFNSPSEAASIIWGSNLNGKKVFGIDGEKINTHNTKIYFDIDDTKAIEGYEKDRVLITKYRNKKLIEERKKLDNYICKICNYRMQINGKHILECHHLNPIKLGIRETTIDDLITVCPNCHRIIHTREPIYTPDEIKELLKVNGTIKGKL